MVLNELGMREVGFRSYLVTGTLLRTTVCSSPWVVNKSESLFDVSDLRSRDLIVGFATLLIIPQFSAFWGDSPPGVLV